MLYLAHHESVLVHILLLVPTAMLALWAWIHTKFAHDGRDDEDHRG